MSGFMEDVTVDYWISNHDECMKVLNDGWDKIPLLGLVPDYLLKEGRLVRFRGMVQDMHNPVFFMSKYEALNKVTGAKEIRSGKFRESLSLKENETVIFESESCENRERRPYYCINTPGLNAWACPEQNVDYSTELPGPSPSSQMKRGAEDMEVEVQKTEEQIANKRQCSAPGPKEVSKEVELHFPIAGPRNYACLVNLYDVEDGCVKVNDIIETVGFLWFPMEDNSETELPGSLLPRLHSVSFKKISNSNPLYLNNHCIKSEILSNAPTLREKLHELLTELLLGDFLAADYFICHLLSSIFLRQDVLALGKFAVNISNVPLVDNYTEHVYNVISELVAKSHYLPMSLKNMNSLQFLPEKDYESNRLKSGVLQLSNNTHLILDETKLEAGKLEAKGVNNLKAVNELITTQSLNYEFKFYRMEFHTDIPVLILSEGKSLLESDVHVIMKPVKNYTDSLQNHYEAVKGILKEPLLSQLRTYIPVAAFSEFTMPDDMLEVIQNDFVKMRQDPDLKTSTDDLHTLLVLARLMSLSYGCGTLTKETWDKCRDMEISRKLRIAIKNSSFKK